MKPILAEPALYALSLMLLLLLIIGTGLVAMVIFFVWYFRRSKGAKTRPPVQPPPVAPSTQIVSRKCPQCGAALQPDVPEGLCPACLLQRGIATEGGVPPGTPPFVPPTIPDLARLFPQLEILELIGKGGMGAVYKARQPALDRFVALKILAPRSGGDLDFAGRFTREARALARLSHPNIVAVYDFGVVGQASSLPGEAGKMPAPQHYFIMEFVDGPNLRQAGRLSPREAMEIIPQICAALQFAHDEGIVHRDIKPENVLLDKKGRVKIADFGLAKILGQEPTDFRLTGVRDVMGTPHYMAPEQIEKPQEVDHRADIYSLGVVFYEMLTGELPLGKFQPPSQKVQMDVRLDEVVLRSLAKEPELRYQHVSEVGTRVETIAGSATIGAPPVMTSTGSPMPKPDRFWRRFAVVMACVLLIPIAIAIFGILAAMAIPAFVKGRQHAQALHQQIEAREQQHIAAQNLAIRSDYIGKTWFPKGDSIEILSVTRSPVGMTVKGRYNLVSTDSADLTLNITSTNEPGVAQEPTQSLHISKGQGDFELSRSHLVSGLPHVSMYANGGSFAGVYFGTKDEALEESRLELDAPSASTEIWSPALAPNEKPDLQKILQEAKDLASQGRYEESLQRHLWYHNHALEFDQGQTGVRLSFALSDWLELGRHYPKAKAALVEILDQKTRELSEGRGFPAMFQEVAAINSELQHDDATYALFKNLREQDPKLAQQCYFYVESLLVSKGEYQLCLDYMGSPQVRFNLIRQSLDMQRDSQKRMAEARQRTAQQIAEMNQKRGRTNTWSPPDTSEMMKRPAIDRFVGQTRQLIEILVATGQKDAAEKIRDQAMAILDDTRLKFAVSDAEQKIANRAGKR